MMHPGTQIGQISAEIGCGVFATQFIPMGTIVYVKDALELEISPEKYHAFPAELQQVVEKYSYIDENGQRIVSWDHAKYVNHCCNCNTMSTGYGFEIAIRDIQPGEEITDEYGLFNLEYEMELYCRQPGCRRKIGPGDMDLYADQWDAKAKLALSQLEKVDQPLLPLIEAKTRADLQSYLEGREEYRSVRSLVAEKVGYFSGNGR